MCFKKRRTFFHRLFYKRSASGPDIQVYVESPEEDSPNKNHLSKREIVTKYRLHIFVGIIFVITLLFVSLGWYFRDLSRAEKLSEQKIFFDPRKRVLTLSDQHDEIEMLLGQDLPQWQLPLHCPVHPDGNPNTKQCEWKGNALLRVHYFVAEAPSGGSGGGGGGGGASAQCYNVSWETLSLPRVPYDCFDVGTAVWYGSSNQSEETLPIRGSFDYVPNPYHLSNSGIFSSAVDFYWLSSSGVGLLLDPNNPLSVHWNSSQPSQLCVISNYSGPLYGDTSRLPTMNYTICNGPDPLQTHLIMKRFLTRAQRAPGRPPADMLGFPQWSVSRLTGNPRYNQQDVLDTVARFKMHGLNCSLLMMDGDWQANHGDLTFDKDRFANLTNMTDIVTSTCNLGLQVSPYFDYRSVNNFHEGVAKDLFVRDAGGQVPGLTRWQKGPAVAVLDVSLGAARAWYNALITHLLKDSGARALRLSYGHEGWLPYKATFSQKSLSLHGVRSRMSSMVAEFSERLVLEHTSGSQGVAGFVAVPTRLAVRRGRTCLVQAVEEALTLGLLGYPYVLADGIRLPGSDRGGPGLFHSHHLLRQHQPSSFHSSSSSSSSSSQSSVPLSRDLFTRWMQMAAFFPAWQFSLGPWEYDEGTVRLAANLSRLHGEVMAKALLHDEVVLKEVAEEGLPILRPVWWLDPGNAQLHAQRVNDEFLVGRSVLVAPVLCEGVNQRSIYVPPGVWSDRLRNTIVVGPKVLQGYRVELGEVPYFEKMPTYEDTKHS